MPGEKAQAENKNIAKKFSLRKNFIDDFIKSTFGFGLKILILM